MQKPLESFEPEQNEDTTHVMPRGDVSKQTGIRGLASLERLRNRIEATAHELERLRETNHALMERIQELETRPDIDPENTFVVLPRDAEHMRRKIAAFIEAVDSCLEREQEQA